MRKNNFNAKVLERYYYSVFEIKGLNLDRLIETLKKRGITLYNVKKKANNRLIVTISAIDSQKLFAISKELCYNIMKLKDKGKLYPIIYLIKNVGILLGALIFTLGCYLSNDKIFAITYSGSAVEYSAQVQEFLDKKGITTFTNFSSFNTKVLASEIMGQNPNLSFVSCTKKGNRLHLELALQSKDKLTLTGKQKDLFSSVEGVVEQVKVYRGTAVVSQGDTVKKGDLLVSSKMMVNEKELEVNVVAYVTIKTKVTCNFTSPISDDNSAVAFALGLAGDKAIIDYSLTKRKDKNQYIYQVHLICRHVIYVG